ncbi:MOSC domain-containing protein [Amycolatopsis acidiphila]|uniref:MOSC domain-containing protein n=1 Tax=Amycolatopsis acidiphila TaxID=715473 RepID=A0A558AM40_9PSEU|nr:MOSC N-terminal beta barrel domain-containing protein [Amycolatopsis acidiphila]TVT25332.1 MOSC domain-containing protein [Amycolatopsis acidiphila]UIJ62459.1 MOSC domain-containing protein [Amycolatopsis acidiphila]GHG83787.1 molybdenum cofactor biosysynthesis protein [Amycolatopsis acidiphila]
MRVVALWRYPVKSTLGEEMAELRVDSGGVDGDRALAVIDTFTGFVATAKHPRLWRMLLEFAAMTEDRVFITFPDGTKLPADAPAVAPRLSAVLGRSITVSGIRPDGASVERPAPEDVLDHGVTAVVSAQTLEIGQGSPGCSFVDHSPVHLITTATLRHLGTESVRYRPNLIVDTPPGTAAFVENSWLGREIQIGDDAGARLRVTIPTPRCAVPSLAHGALPRDPDAVRTVMKGNRIEVPGFEGAKPCAGAYAEVIRSGTVRVDDPITMP